MLYTKVKGVQDIYSPEIHYWEFLEDVSKKVLNSYGYDELRIPILEHTELFLRGIGENTDIVQKEMYTFKDKKERSLTLRPEGTASAVRALIENNLFKDDPIQKIFYNGPMFRYERPQKGRYRQFYQIGAELFGIKEPEADFEIIMLINDIFGALGIKKTKIALNSIGCKLCRPNFQLALNTFFKSKKEKLCQNCFNRLDKNPLRLLDCKEESCKALHTDHPVMENYLCEECKNHFEQLQKLFRTFKVDYFLDHNLVRGLDYYTKTIFEFVSDSLGSQNSLLGGGRYDCLVEDFGYEPIPAVGFAFGVERIIMEMKVNGITKARPSSIYLIYFDEESKKIALNLLYELRSNNFRTELLYDKEASFKRQLKRSSKAGAKFSLIIGNNEIQNNEILIKEMESGKQFPVKKEALLTFLKGKL